MPEIPVQETNQGQIENPTITSAACVSRSLLIRNLAPEALTAKVASTHSLLTTIRICNVKVHFNLVTGTLFSFGL